MERKKESNNNNNKREDKADTICGSRRQAHLLSDTLKLAMEVNNKMARGVLHPVSPAQ